MTKEQVKKILNDNKISVKKQYGQNFLLDENILNKISSTIDNEDDNYIIEIGPGLGFLTNYLANKAQKVLCYEIDYEMIENLSRKSYQNVMIINDDFLKRDIDKDCVKYFGDGNVCLVANLPYYITTPILLKVLEESKKVKKMIVMMQTEVAKRICGSPSTKDYNSLSVLIQYFTLPKILFNVSNKSFYPEPNVESSVVEIKYKEKLEEKAINLEYFLSFNRHIFLQRRKTFLNNISKSYDYDKKEVLKILEKNNIKQDVRSEALSVEQIVKLSNEFYEKFEKNNSQND